MPFGKVNGGDPFAFPATLYNVLIDMAVEYQARRRNPRQFNAGLAGNNLCIVPIQNDSGADVDWFGVLGVDDFLITPSDNLDEFKGQPPMLSGVSVEEGTHEGKFAICLEPIEAGAIGRAAVAPVVACQVYVTTDTRDFEYADVSGSPASLRMVQSGSARILARETTAYADLPKLAWAYVSLGHQGDPVVITKHKEDDDGGGTHAKDGYRDYYLCDDDGIIVTDDHTEEQKTISVLNRLDDINIVNGRVLYARWKKDRFEAMETDPC